LCPAIYLPIKSLAETLFEAKPDMRNIGASNTVSSEACDLNVDPRDRIGTERKVVLRLVYRSKSSLPRNKADLSIFESSNLGKAYFPIRTLPYSIIYHIAVFCTVFYLQVTHFAAENTRLLQKTVETGRNEPEIVMFLPILGSGFPFDGAPAAKPEEPLKAPPKEVPKEPAQATAAASSSSKKGLVYPGPQPILSNPPDPTNRIQTLLQPAIEDPVILAPPLSLPNMVQVADNTSVAKPDLIDDIGPIEAPPIKQPEAAEPEPLPNPLEELRAREPIQSRLLDIQPAKADEVKLEIPPVKVAPPSESDAPKLVMPPMVVSNLEPPPDPVPEEAHPTRDLRPDITEESVGKALAATASPVSEDPLKTAYSPKIVNRREEATLPPSSPLGGYGSDQKDLLALTPIPAPIKLPIQVPSGEARGSFAISPKPNLDTSETESGTLADILATESGSGDQTTAAAGGPISESAVRNITFGGSGKSTESKDSAYVGIASGSTGGASAGSARGKGTGTGEGASGRKGPFSGITIVGGSYDAGAAANPDPVIQAPKPLRTSYGVTVISTENSGGGLPYVGVFSNEQIYTVYLDVRETESDSTPSWILEFALFPDSSDAVDISGDPAESKEGLILPFPITKKFPALPADLVRQHLNEVIIVYAVINDRGKLGKMSVKQSPDRMLNQPLLSALSEWSFRPAQLYGKPVAIKALLGIPLWIPQQSSPGILNLGVF
jgi:hypothetical protein